MLEVARAAILSRGPVVVMGGWVQPPAAGLPPWGPEMDFNVQWDTRAAEVAPRVPNSRWLPFRRHSRLTFVPRTYRASESRTTWRATGPAVEAHPLAYEMGRLGRAHSFRLRVSRDAERPLVGL
jgi:hypothetical protein